MAIDSQKAKKALPKLKENVEQSYQYFESNQKRFNEFMKFVFKDSLTQQDKDVLDLTGKPVIQFNIIEPYISRLLGEFSKQEPNIEVNAKNDSIDIPDIHVTEGIMRSILSHANNESFEYEVEKEVLGGGYSVMKVWTEYEDEDSFDQRIRIGKVFDPTLTGFDPMARLSHKGDGAYCFEIHPMSKSDFEVQYPNEKVSELSFTKAIESFNWTFQQNKEDIVLLCDYYEKKKKNVTIYKLSNNKVVDKKEYDDLISNWSSFEQPPQIVKTRTTQRTFIKRYVFIEDRILEEEETLLKRLPLIFVDGNSVHVKTTMEGGSSEQVTRPYAYQAEGAQRLKNFAGQCLANELENMMQSKYIVDPESIPTGSAVDDWNSPQKASTLLAKTRNKDGAELRAPMIVQRGSIPPEISQSFMGMDQTLQNILGSYDAQLGINSNQLSGTAIVEGATQNNAVAMPYIVGFLAALNAAAQMILEMIPIYYVTPRTVPVVDKKGKRVYMEINKKSPNGMPVQGSPQLTYKPSALEVVVKAGYNFEVQKERSLKTMMSMMQHLPSFNQMMNTKGLPILMDNLDIRGAGQLKEMAEQFTEQMEQQQHKQGEQQNPQAMMAMKDMQLKEQKMMADNQFRQQELMLEQEKIKNQKLKMVIDAESMNKRDAVQITKADAERQKNAADLAIKSMDMHHSHNMDKANFISSTRDE